MSSHKNELPISLLLFRRSPFLSTFRAPQDFIVFLFW